MSGIGRDFWHRRDLRCRPEAKVIQVIEVRALRGKGVAPDDPVREVTTYYALDGALLAERDPATASPDPLP